MADKKIVSAKDAKKGDYSKAKEKDTTNLRSQNRKKSSMKFRIPAIILWVLAIAAEVAAIYLFNTGHELTPILIALGIDAVLVIIGSLLWKKANKVSPCTSKSKVVCFLQNQLGVIVALIAFIPFGFLYLKNAKNLPAKTKQVLGVVLLALVLVTVGTSIEYNPATLEEVEAAELVASANGVFDGTVYWTRYGYSYHIDPDCPRLARSTVIIEGNMAEAFEASREDPCDVCSGGDIAKQQAQELIDGGQLEDLVEEAAEETTEEEPAEAPAE